MNPCLMILVRTFLLIAASAVAMSARAVPPPPPTFTVNDHAQDLPDDNPGNGACHTTAGTCTLRAAIMEANRAINGAMVVLPAGTYVLTILPDVCADSGDDACGDLNLKAPTSGNPAISIVGAGAASTIIDGNKIDRLFNVESGRTVNISGVTIRNGYRASLIGAGIFNGGTLTLTQCTISGNEGHAYGGGLSNYGTLYLNQSSVTGNTTTDFGGGLFNNGVATVSASTFSANIAVAGGGIQNGNSATLSVDTSTISGNTATGSIGGGIGNSHVLIVSNSTISANHASTNGGGIWNNSAGVANFYNTTIAYNEADADFDSVGDGAGIYNNAGGVFNLRNSLVAGNYLSGQQDYEDCFGEIGIFGNDQFYAIPPQCVVAANSLGTSSYIGSLNEIGILANRGGPTQTIALVPPSNLIGGAVGCDDQNGMPIVTDQRGRQRPPPASNRCDIGAFEYNEIFADGF